MENYVSITALLEKQAIGKSHETVVFDHFLLVFETVIKESFLEGMFMSFLVCWGDLDDG